MTRTWVLMILCALGDSARAAPPSAYECNPGTPKTGVGCVCPRGYQERRDGDNTAICYVRSPVAPKPAAPTRSKTTRTPLKVAATPIALVAKPLPPLSPSFTGPHVAYKAAWASIAARNLQAGVDALKQLATTKDAAVRRAVVDDVPRVYVELGPPETALGTFKTLPDAPAILEGLGKLYLAKPNADAAFVVYRGASSAYPTHPNRCAWLEAAGRAAAASTVTTISEKVAAATAVATEWQRIKPRATACRDGAAALVGELARWAHGQPALDAAETLYRLYGSTFSELPAAPEHAYYLAELLWMRAETLKSNPAWEAAAVAFTDAARTGSLSPARTKEAAYAAVLGWKNALAKETAVAPANFDLNDTSPKPVAARDTKMLAAFDLYIANVTDPTDDELPVIKYLKANIYRQSNRLDEAIALFREIVKLHPGSDVAELSAQLVLDFLNRRQRFSEMRVFIDELLADAGLLANKDAFRETLIKLKRAGLARRAMELASEGSPAKAIECGKTFIEQYNADPLASDSAMALFNAMTCFEKGEAWTSSLKVFAVFEQYHSNSRDYPLAKAMAAIAKAKLGK